jgi:flagellar basal-body rod protein FlgB
MGGLAARQRAIANNVANADTPNFKASEVRFEDTLKTAISRGRPGATTDQTALNAAASRTSLIDSTSARGDGNNVDIDREM